MGRFIGRLGIVPMPAIERGFGLVERVVRRHVAKLEGVGWCERMPAIRGDGSLVWMTAAGLAGVDLGELPALRSPHPFSPQTLHAIRVAWAAADIERAGHRWHAVRELAAAPHRWGAEVANERGGRSRRLPDLVFWPARDDTRPVAVVVGHGPPSPRRERAALRGWQDAIAAGQYPQVRYLAHPAATGRFEHMAVELGLTDAQFIVGDDLVAAVPPAPADVVEKLDETEASAELPPAVASPPLPAPVQPAPRAMDLEVRTSPPEPDAERQMLIRELIGQDE